MYGVILEHVSVLCPLTEDFCSRGAAEEMMAFWRVLGLTNPGSRLPKSAVVVFG